MFRRIVITLAAAATLATTAAPAAQAAPTRGHAPSVTPQPAKPDVGTFRSSWS